MKTDNAALGLTAGDIERVAAELPRDFIQETPLVFHERLSGETGMSVYLKMESLQRVRSYKIRGACYVLMTLPQELRKKGVTCASAGNHSQGVAASCHYFQVNGRIFMPKTTPHQKVEATKRFGNGFVEVELAGDTFDDACSHAYNYQRDSGAHFVHPFDNGLVIAAQGTVAAEILNAMNAQGKRTDAIIAPVGGGGLVSGISVYCKEKSPPTIVYGVEPAESAAMHASLLAGNIVSLDKKTMSTFVDGAAVLQPGERTFRIVRENAVRVVTVPENRVCSTMRDLHDKDGIMAEPAGALAIDALKDLGVELRGKNVVCVLSGNNFDPRRWGDVIERSEIYEARKRYLAIELPGREQALKELLSVFPSDVDISFLHFDQRTKSGGETAPPLLIGLIADNPAVLMTLLATLRETRMKVRDVTNEPLLHEMLGS